MATANARRTASKLFLEFVVIVMVMAGAAVAIYYGFRAPPIHDVLPLGGRNVDVSNSRDPQFEASVAAEPADPQRLVATSMDGHIDARVYSSSDGGATWRSAQAPPAQRAPCGLSHPSVAIGGHGRQAVASLVSETCQPADPLLVVAVRDRADGAWRVRHVGPTGRYAFDQRPTVAVDDRGVVYVVWPRLLGEFSSRQVLLFSRSTDGGATWSTPERIGRYGGVYGVDLVARSGGALLLAVSDGVGRRVDVLRSTNGGSTWSDAHLVARLRQPYVLGCGEGSTQVAAQPQRCMSAIARIAVSPRSVAIVYSDATADGTQAVFAATSDRDLREPFQARRVGDGKGKVDRFLPTVAYDTSTDDLWACYYDTEGDPRRKHAWYTCTVSRDGARTWEKPVHAASGKSNEAETGSDPNGYGDVQGLVAFGGDAHPVWTDNRHSLQTAEEIYTATIPAPRLRR